MCNNLEARATIPARNLERARQWYADKLGFTPSGQMPGGYLYDCENSGFALYETEYAGTAKNTALSFTAEDFDREIADLRAKGIKFEDYDMGDLKTVNGIVTMDGTRGAWFKDLDGNILSIVERVH